MVVEVGRNLFFDSITGSLLFSEKSPHEEHEDHQICNCTKSVKERPLGEPNEVKQYITFKENIDNYDFTVALESEGCNFTLRWPGFVSDERWGNTPYHAYYWFNTNGYNNCLQVEIIKEGYGETNCFFGNVFFGNDVDISYLMNGHSKSRIIDLTKIRSDEVWAHECSWGKEAMISFKGNETREWLRVYDLSDKISEQVRTYEQDFVSDVAVIRERVEADDYLLFNVRSACRWFAWVTRYLESTELFRCADFCRKNTLEKN